MNKYKNGENKNDNYTITIKIDADIEKYVRNITPITFIDNLKRGQAYGETFTDYVNSLIRKDMLQKFQNGNISTIDELLESYKIKGE